MKKVAGGIKRLLFFGLLFLIGHLPSLGQTHYSSNISIGAKGGMDFSRVFFNPGVHQKFAMGTTFGVMARYIEENHFGLIGEVNFAQRGWVEDFEGAPYNYKKTINYIDVGALAHIYFGRRAKFVFNAGPQVGFVIGNSTKANFDPYKMNSLPDFPNINRENEQMLIEVSQKIDYGIAAGLGGEFNINRRNSIAIEARFYYGLGNIMPSKRADTFNASNQMTISATIGYWFRIK